MITAPIPVFVFMMLFIGLLMLVLIGVDARCDALRKEAIERGFAHYHAKTGEFTWGAP